MEYCHGQLVYLYIVYCYFYNDSGYETWPQDIKYILPGLLQCRPLLTVITNRASYGRVPIARILSESAKIQQIRHH